jgi:hypothetical protein
MRIEKTASIELKVLKKRFTNDSKRPAAHSAAVAEQVLVAYGILDTENMKKVMVTYNTNSAAFELTGPTPLIERLLTDDLTFDAHVGIEQIFKLHVQIIDENAVRTRSRTPHQVQNRARLAARRR